jgi:hypothetical protein
MEKEYRYYIRLGKYKLAFVVMLIGIVFSFYKFAYNQSSYRFMHIFIMDAEQSKTFFLVLGIILLALSLGTALFSLLWRGEIILTGSGVILPKTVAGSEQTVSYGSILHVTEEKVKKQRIASIFTKSGKQYSVVSDCLDSEADYDEFLTALASNIKNIRNRMG